MSSLRSKSFSLTNASKLFALKKDKDYSKEYFAGTFQIPGEMRKKCEALLEAAK